MDDADMGVQWRGFVDGMCIAGKAGRGNSLGT